MGLCFYFGMLLTKMQKALSSALEIEKGTVPEGTFASCFTFFVDGSWVTEGLHCASL